MAPGQSVTDKELSHSSHEASQDIANSERSKELLRTAPLLSPRLSQPVSR